MFESKLNTNVRDYIVKSMRKSYEEKSAMHEPSGKYLLVT